MIKIFESNAKEFNSNGIVVINPIDITEYKKISLNGWYLEVVVSSKYKEYIIKDRLCVVKTKSKLNPQAFRIDNPEIDDDQIKFNAYHVVFDAENYFLVDVRPTDMSANNALNWVNERTDISSPFVVYSNVETVNTHYFEYKNLLEAFQIIEKEWGGIYDVDNWSIKLLNSIGIDNGKILVYKKNLEGINAKEDWSNVCTRIYGKGPNNLTLPEIYLDSDISYSHPYTKSYTFESSLEDSASEEEKIAELRSKMIKYLKDNREPLVSYEITSNSSFKIDDYDIGDIIHVKHPYVNLKVSVVEYTRDLNTNRFNSIVLGNYIPDVKQKFNEIKGNINKISSNLSTQEKIINDQTKLINSFGKKGRIYIDDNELLILDDFPKEKAKYVWRYNAAGWGFSENGYEGPFKLAATIDGSINADFITSGKISTSLIKGLEDLVFLAKNIRLEGYISANGNVSIDESGTATFKNAVIQDGNIELYDSNNDQSESILIYNKDSVEIVEKSLELGLDFSGKEIIINIPDDLDPDITSPSISRNVLIEFENGSICYTNGYQYSYNPYIFYYDNLSQEYSDIYFREQSLSVPEINLKKFIIPSNAGKITAIYSNYKNGSIPLVNYFSYSIKNIKYFIKMNSKGVIINKDSVNTQYLGNGILIIDKNGTRVFNEDGITWMTPYGQDYKEFIVNKDTCSYNGNRLVGSGNIFKLNLIDQESPYLEINLLENIQGFSAYGVTVWASDKRLKENILDSSFKALEFINKIKHRQFDFKSNKNHIEIGYIADELEDINKNCIFKVGKDNLKQINESFLIPIITKAIQEQQLEIENLKKEILNLKKGL